MTYDLIIVGGGIVGATLAIALKDSALRVALIDSAPFNTKEDARLIALNDSSVCLFQNLDCWKTLAPHASAIEQIHVSHRGHLGITRIAACDVRLSALGYVVPARHINTALYTALENTKNIALVRPATVQAISQNSDEVTLTLTSAKKFIAKNIVAADGSYSTLRDLLSIPTQIIDYQQSALVTITELQRPHQQIAYERFQEKGAIAMLPLPNQRAATIWTSDNETISHLLKLTDAEFLATLQKQFGYRLGRLTKTHARTSYPLKMLRAEQQLKQRVLFIGNAAHTLHPIAAQGLNLALYEIAILAELLQKNTFTLDQLPKYNEQQNFSQQLSHQLTWLFSSDFFIFNIARSLGMIGFDLFPTLKKRFALRSIGKKGNIPRLLVRKGPYAYV